MLRRIHPVLKAINGSLLALTVVTILAGCGKKDAGAPETAATTAQPPAAAATPAEPHPLPSTAPSDVKLTGIAKAEGGKTVEEIFNEKDALANQRISLRGKVVKVNANIMGTNWVHVRDGTGAEGSNDLTVTTNSPLPDVGETVLVTGTVTLDKDFGMGYQYPVILDSAEVTVE
jgi:hypothetical protein